MRRAVLVASLAAVGLASSLSLASATGPFTVPQVAYATSTIPAGTVSPEVHATCLVRSEVSGSQVMQRMICYYTRDTAPPPPPPPFQPPRQQVRTATFDATSGQLTSVVLACTPISSGLAIKIHTTAQLSKTGSPVSGSTVLTEDTTAPFDCAGGTTATGPLSLTPFAQSHDQDKDGCTDWEELGTDQTFGGRRDPFNVWDFADMPPRNQIVLSGDIGAVVARYGADDAEGSAPINRYTDPLSPPPPAPAYHPAFDRGGTVGPNGWNLSPADGIIRTGDISAVVASYGHDCLDPP